MAHKLDAASSIAIRGGKLELHVPRDCDGRFSAEPLKRFHRSEKALVLELAEMYM